MNQLPVSRLVSASVTLAPLAAQSQSLTDLLVLGTSSALDFTELLRTYASLDAVGVDFSSSSPEYLAAQAYFSQSPSPARIRIARWAQAATAGRLTGAPLTTGAALSAWTAISNGSMSIVFDGGSATVLSSLNFSSVTNLNGVASVINAALSGGRTVTYVAAQNRFIVESGTTGASSTVGFATATGSGTDISVLTGFAVTVVGSYATAGRAAMPIADAITELDGRFGRTWYGLFAPTATDNAVHLSAAATIGALRTLHIYFATTQEATALLSANTTNLGYLAKQQNLARICVLYSSTSIYDVAAFAAKALTIDYLAANTVITLVYKQLAGSTAEGLTTAQADALASFNLNVFAEFNNDRAIVINGVMADGTYVDERTGSDWLAATLETELFNTLYTTTTKIPQTDGGVAQLTNAAARVCQQGVINGLFASGTWTGNDFGTLRNGDLLSEGYYVYAGPIAQQFAADRAARKAPPIQVAARFAGAIHTSNVLVTIVR